MSQCLLIIHIFHQALAVLTSQTLLTPLNRLEFQTVGNLVKFGSCGAE